MYMHKIYALEFISRIIKWYKFNTIFIVLQQQQSQQEDTPVISRSFKEVWVFFKIFLLTMQCKRIIVNLAKYLPPILSNFQILDSIQIRSS